MIPNKIATLTYLKLPKPKVKLFHRCLSFVQLQILQENSTQYISDNTNAVVFYIKDGKFRNNIYVYSFRQR